jgi:hypothetical protein
LAARFDATGKLLMVKEVMAMGTNRTNLRNATATNP